jgi:hypothetical protein
METNSRSQEFRIKKVQEHAPWKEEPYFSWRVHSLSAEPSVLAPPNWIANILHPSTPAASARVDLIRSQSIFSVTAAAPVMKSR